MGAALSIFVLLSLSVFVIRVASVALRITGLTDASARFQALSAFTGTGFTTSEAETVVNYPVRRRVVSILMIIGNMGLVTVFATVVVSLVHTDGEVQAVVEQLVWLLGGLGLLWFLMLNKTADRILCAGIANVLNATTLLGKRRFQRLLQTGDGHSVCEHPLPPQFVNKSAQSVRSELDHLELMLLFVPSSNGDRIGALAMPSRFAEDHTLVLFGPDSAHDALEGASPDDS